MQPPDLLTCTPTLSETSFAVNQSISERPRVPTSASESALFVSDDLIFCDINTTVLQVLAGFIFPSASAIVKTDLFFPSWCVVTHPFSPRDSVTFMCLGCKRLSAVTAAVAMMRLKAALRSSTRESADEIKCCF